MKHLSIALFVVAIISCSQVKNVQAGALRDSDGNPTIERLLDTTGLLSPILEQGMLKIFYEWKGVIRNHDSIFPIAFTFIKRLSTEAELDSFVQAACDPGQIAASPLNIDLNVDSTGVLKINKIENVINGNDELINYRNSIKQSVLDIKPQRLGELFWYNLRFNYNGQTFETPFLVDKDNLIYNSILSKIRKIKLSNNPN